MLRHFSVGSRILDYIQIKYEMIWNISGLDKKNKQQSSLFFKKLPMKDVYTSVYGWINCRITCSCFTTTSSDSKKRSTRMKDYKNDWKNMLSLLVL